MRLQETDARKLVFKSPPRRCSDLTGKQYGSLWVLGVALVIMKKVSWFCRCECGTLCQFPSSYLTSGRNTHCGCLDGFRSGGTLSRHGRARTPIYKIWQGMHERCRGTTRSGKKYYLDKGITVCDRWKSFENFLADMGDRPSSKHSLDRIDGNGNYEPGNCRWATDTEQNRNRSNTTMLTIGGVTKPATQWAEESGLAIGTIKQRINLGWKDTDLLLPKQQGHEVTCNANPCSCSSRRKFGVVERVIGAVRRYQERGDPISLRQLCNRARLNQAEMLKLCDDLGLVVQPDGTEWMRRWAVVEPTGG